jgi:hypothetical protein
MVRALWVIFTNGPRMHAMLGPRSCLYTPKELGKSTKKRKKDIKPSAMLLGEPIPPGNE